MEANKKLRTNNNQSELKSFINTQTIINESEEKTPNPFIKTEDEKNQNSFFDYAVQKYENDLIARENHYRDYLRLHKKMNIDDKTIVFYGHKHKNGLPIPKSLIQLTNEKIIKHLNKNDNQLISCFEFLKENSTNQINFYKNDRINNLCLWLLQSFDFDINIKKERSHFLTLSQLIEELAKLNLTINKIYKNIKENYFILSFQIDDNGIYYLSFVINFDDFNIANFEAKNFIIPEEFQQLYEDSTETINTFSQKGKKLLLETKFLIIAYFFNQCDCKTLY